MGIFKKVNCNPPVQQIEIAVHENGGILSGFGGSFCCPGEHPDQVGEWEIRLVDTRGNGNEGFFVAIAATEKAYRVQEAATLRILREMADKKELRSPNFLKEERGDIGMGVFPLAMSPLSSKRGYFLAKDDKWAYYCIAHSNYLRPFDDRVRLWVKPVVKGKKRRK